LPLPLGFYDVVVASFLLAVLATELLVPAAFVVANEEGAPWSLAGAEANALIHLLTEAVRNIDTVKKCSDNTPIEHYAVDVDPAPKCNDPSYAEIYTDPEITSRGVFRRLQARMICLSNWAEGFGPSDREEGNI
jgi:hypothetical protein